MSMVGFPFLLIPLAIYNIIVFLMPGVDLAAPLVTLPLTSGAPWPVTLSDVLLSLGILMLLCEVVKGARPGAKYLTDHLLSLLILAGAIAEFLLWPRFANSTFFLLTLLALAEFLSGVALRVRRVVPAVVTTARSRGRIDPEISHEPADVHALPAEAVIEPAHVEPITPAPAEPVVVHRVEEPGVHHDEPVPPHVSSPEVPSPDLQPDGNGTPRPPETPSR